MPAVMTASVFVYFQSTSLDMPIFKLDRSAGVWKPSPIAAGPFAGMQGGAVAGLLVGEMEAIAAVEGWGDAVAISVWFLKPTPVVPLRTRLQRVRAGGRVSVIDNAVTPEGASEPTALARATFMRARSAEAPGFMPSRARFPGPERLQPQTRRAPHGGPWFMDAMEARAGDGIVWFRMKDSIIEGAGAMAGVVGPADWTHGLARPLQGVLADPNPNLNVHLLRPPVGPWIGIQAATEWLPELGAGFGRGILVDGAGKIGAVSMSVALAPFPVSSQRAES
jgi:hypothetical protein